MGEASGDERTDEDSRLSFSEALKGSSASLPDDLTSAGSAPRRPPSPPAIDLPIAPPAWFVDATLVARDFRRWLLRGRDQQSGQTFAMKILEFPAGVNESVRGRPTGEADPWDAVRNPAWVRANVDRVGDRYVVAFREWVHGYRWDDDPARCTPARLRRLAAVAFALQAAHEASLHHGNLVAGNLYLDHAGQVRIVDAGIRGGRETFIGPAPAGSQATATDVDPARLQDLRQLWLLIAAEAVHANVASRAKLIEEALDVWSGGSHSIGAEWGDLLLRHAEATDPRGLGSRSQESSQHSSQSIHHKNTIRAFARRIGFQGRSRRSNPDSDE